MPRLTRNQILALLLATVAALGTTSLVIDEGFDDSILSNLFWLFAGVLFTTFVLEAVLNRDIEARQTALDRFAMQSDLARMLRSLHLITSQASQGVDPTLSLLDPTAFAALTSKLAGTYRNVAPNDIDGEAHKQLYLDISSSLREFSFSFIRVFSTSREDMVTNHIRLIDLANEWRYEDALVYNDGIEELKTRLHSEPKNDYDVERLDRLVADREAARNRVVTLVRSTVDEIADVARRAVGPGFYE